MNILLTGSGGMIGSGLLDSLSAKGHELIRLVRTPTPAEKTVILWEPESEHSIDPSSFEGLDAVVHLAGESIATGRWTTDKKARIRNSRVQGTALIASMLARLKHKPGIFLSASAVGYYGNRKNQVLTEDSARGTGFLAGVCRDWEAATEAAAEAGIRVARLRIGMVLSAKGGALPKMVKPFKLGLGGTIGGGKQYYSWIDIEDTIRAIEFILENESISGPINLTSPNPATNRDFTKALGQALSRPTIVPLPAFAARSMLGEMAVELMLASARVLPKRLQDAGFEFKHPDLQESLQRHVSDLSAKNGEEEGRTIQP